MSDEKLLQSISDMLDEKLDRKGKSTRMEKNQITFAQDIAELKYSNKATEIYLESLDKKIAELQTEVDQMRIICRLLQASGEGVS